MVTITCFDGYAGTRITSIIRGVNTAANTKDDEALVVAFKAGDVSAYDILFDRYQRRILSYMYQSTADRAMAEELTQDVFLKVFLNLRRTSPDTNFRAWIYRIATNAAISLARKRSHRPPETGVDPVEETAFDGAFAIDGDPEKAYLRREQLREIILALAALPETHRQVLVLRQMQELSYTEIAEVMGLSVEAVTSLLYRARQSFKAAYDSVSHGAGKEVK